MVQTLNSQERKLHSQLNKQTELKKQRQQRANTGFRHYYGAFRFSRMVDRQSLFQKGKTG